ncbi:DUF4419 domain-containing protein [Longispora sp. K20-0274]|uniref:DUF4419 domain-containing protein n=1 Tax=Longispora sp. K20-0274 TaxID=3088255 RepID=UPI00399BAF12
MIFQVDDVTPAASPLPTVPLRSVSPGALAVGGDPDRRVLVPSGVHPLLAAVGRAFAEHRPLILSPDAVWLTIAQGVAQHVRLHAEELRERLVAHQGRRDLTVPVDAVPVDAASWSRAVDRFADRLEGEVGELPGCDFSTSTAVERTAGRVVMLDVYSPYFAFVMVAVCGIPTVTLTGTVEDWRRIAERVDTLDRYGLHEWRRSLAPIAAQFVRAAAGDVDTAFWRRIYNPVDAYGGKLITGWAARFYPYLLDAGSIDRPNPLLELPLDEPRDLTVGHRSYDGPGISSAGVPATLSTVRITIDDRALDQLSAVELHAGLVGIAQDPDGALRPVAGWHLLPSTVHIDQVLDRIVAEHETTPPVAAWMKPYAVSAEALALYHRFGSAADRHRDCWRILSVADHQHVLRRQMSVTAIAKLADGRSLAVGHQSGAAYWMVCRIGENPDRSHILDPRHRLMDAPGDVPVIGTSLAEILRRLLDGEDLAGLETGRLSDLDAST